MQLLSYTLGGLCVLSLLGALTATALVQSAPAIPPSPDHGVNNSTHYTLWSGDTDRPETDYEDWTNESSSPIQELARRTDIPLDSPPAAVERWNHGDLHDFPETNARTSIHPPSATLEDGAFVKDAYVEIFAIQPSTRLRTSPTTQPLYAAPNGTVLGTVDYRVELPTDDLSGETQIRHSLVRERIREVRLEVDGVVEATSPGTRTPELNYTRLDQYRNLSHDVTLVAEIGVVLEREIRTCTELDNESNCRDWNVSVEQSTETVTVRDSVDVVEYDLAVSGYRARYPNGDLGLVVYKNLPWQGYSLANGRVRGVWQYYSAQNPEWDTLVTSTESGNEVIRSPLHPLQVHAYPSETGPVATPRRAVTLLDAYGSTTGPPSLPSDVHLEVVEQPYTASYGVAVRSQGTHRLSNVTVHGLVRGVNTGVRNSSFLNLPINESELTLSIHNQSEDSVTVQIELLDAKTGNPIETAGRDGYVVLDGTRVNTTDNGTITRTLSRSTGGVSARYEPGNWWDDSPGYVGDSDSIYIRSSGLPILSILYHFGILVSIYLFGVLIISRFTGWRLWPPWRGL